MKKLSFSVVIQYLLGIMLLVATGYSFYTTLSALEEYGIRVLYADQWRIYTDYFDKPFPANIFALQNGHRPIISGLFFLLDRYLFGASQNFLLISGAFMATTTAGFMVWPSLRDHSIYFLQKAIVIYLTVAGIFWLGNSRVLFHGNESVHAYLVPVFFLAAFNSIVRCHQNNSRPLPLSKTIIWGLLASIFSLMAILSFGAGVAVPPALLIIAFMFRLTTPTKLMLAVNCLFVMVLYFLLPSATHVTGVLVSSRHTQYEIINFFSLLGAPVLFFIGGPEFIFTQSAEPFKSIICPAVGMVGAFVFVWRCIIYFFEKRHLSRAETTPIALLLLTSGVLLIVAVMRSNYFDIYPDQVFANRYLVWSSLFWASFGLEVLNIAMGIQNGRLKKVCASLIVSVCFLSFGIIQYNNQRWLSHLEKWQNKTSRAGVGLEVGVHDQQVVEEYLMESADKIFSLAEKLREERMNVFSGPVSQLVNRNINASYEIDVGAHLTGKLAIDKSFFDPISGTLSAQINFQVDQFADEPMDYVVIADLSGNVTGAAVSQKDRRHFAILPYMHFSGYIKDFNQAKPYRFYGIVNNSSVAVPIISLQ